MAKCVFNNQRRHHPRWDSSVVGVRLVGVGLGGVRLVGVGLGGVSLVGVRLDGVGLVGVGLVRVRLVGIGLVGVGLVVSRSYRSEPYYYKKLNVDYIALYRIVVNVAIEN
jgi:hypothetical protein